MWEGRKGVRTWCERKDEWIEEEGAGLGEEEWGDAQPPAWQLPVPRPPNPHALLTNTQTLKLGR